MEAGVDSLAATELSSGCVADWRGSIANAVFEQPTLVLSQPICSTKSSALRLVWCGHAKQYVHRRAVCAWHAWSGWPLAWRVSARVRLLSTAARKWRCIWRGPSITLDV